MSLIVKLQLRHSAALHRTGHSKTLCHRLVGRYVLSNMRSYLKQATQWKRCNSRAPELPSTHRKHGITKGVMSDKTRGLMVSLNGVWFRTQRSQLSAQKKGHFRTNKDRNDRHVDTGVITACDYLRQVAWAHTRTQTGTYWWKLSVKTNK